MLEIKKIGHCCLLIKINGVVILTDPGSFMAEDSAVSGVDVVVVTHEHRDHFHLQSLKEIIKLNPKVKIFTNGSVGKIMSDQSLVSHILNDGEEIRFDQVKIRAFDAPHEEIYRDRGLVENTAFLFDDRFLYPGDSFYRPDQSIDVLALPVAGPWCLIKNAIDYALDLRWNDKG